jgi:hypothetical protein
MYSSTVIIWVTESGRTRWVKHIAYRGEERVSMGKLSKRETTWKHRQQWEDKIEMGLQ